ncbi:MAG: ASKHA domain-containing protein [Desulfovibrio sp.]|nr:ASKHA domain-containing protein [Desulfovibrio sp.]
MSRTRHSILVKLMGKESFDGTDAALASPVEYQAGQTLAQAIYLSGLYAPPALCSGLAACGRCRVRVTSEPGPEPEPADMRLFAPDELALGWRLACKHHAWPGMCIELPVETRLFADLLRESGKKSAADLAVLPDAASDPGDTTDSVSFYPPTAGDPLRSTNGKTAFLAVDLGTTSLEWRLQANLPQGPCTLWQGKAVNPQMGAGSDLVSRLSFAATDAGRELLYRLTQDALRGLVEQSALVMRAKGLSGGPSALCLAANTAMTAISLGVDTRSLANAPYAVPYAGGQWEALPGLPPLLTPPQPSPFVGGDIAAGYAALALDREFPIPEYPFLLADLGTNGEFLLALAPDNSLATSVALGPALEGIGLSHGIDAQPGAVSNFSFSPYGLEAICVKHSASQRATPSSVPGITATGYLELLHILLTSGAMDRQGYFTPDACGALKRFFTPKRALGTEEARNGAWLPLPLGLRLSARDIEEVLKVKAAFSLGLRRLLDKAGLASRDLKRVYIAGALGLHVNKRALEELGFFPPGMEKRLEAVGNTSLAGASLLLRTPQARPSLLRWAEKVHTLDLAADSAFTHDFAEHMRFVW